MTAGTGTDAATAGRPARRGPRIAQRRTLPADIRALSPMSDPDDVDLTIASHTDTLATPERWMRVTAEDFFRARANRWMLRGLLGLRLAPATSPTHLGGWTIAENDREHIRLEARSWMMDAHLVLRVEPDGASIASFVGYRHPIARLVWGRVVAPSHREELVRLLGQAAQRLAGEEGGDSRPTPNDPRSHDEAPR